MRTCLEFESTAFTAYPDEDEQVNPGRFGKRLAEFLGEVLPAHGFSVASLRSEDWGWRVELENQSFPLWIGCGNLDDSPTDFLCFIEPSRPSVWRWFKKVDTAAVVEKLALALEEALSKSGKVSNLHWAE